MVFATRKHNICAGHRVYNQGGSCEHLHGHEYKFEFTCASANGLNDIGMVIDFGEIKRRLCQWLEENWDHRFLIWDEDPWREALAQIDKTVVWVPFNPTAEQIAEHLVEVIGPQVFHGTGVDLVACIVHETEKCSAEYHREDY
jgi:6-pyruvoyltetrahydropterin/6-carboxytetrahydropterin synthase